jgi:hypothetical protein
VVYCGGLENRFGLTADGGSNPSLSASLRSKRSESESGQGAKRPSCSSASQENL